MLGLTAQGYNYTQIPDLFFSKEPFNAAVLVALTFLILFTKLPGYLLSFPKSLLYRKTVTADNCGATVERKRARWYLPGAGRIRKRDPMKAANANLLTMVLQGSVALSQTTPTEKVAASGSCSTAPAGDNNTYNINCNGIGADQGKKIVEILNRVLANQDLTTVNTKLDELIVVASQPAQTQALQAPPNILGLTVTPLVPRPNLGAEGLIEGPFGVNPGVTVSFTVDGVFTTAMFSVFCDRPCAATSASVEGTSSPQMMTTDKPNIAVVALGLKGPLMPNNKVTITVRSRDAGKISVQNVQSFVLPGH